MIYHINFYKTYMDLIMPSNRRISREKAPPTQPTPAPMRLNARATPETTLPDLDLNSISVRVITTTLTNRMLGHCLNLLQWNYKSKQECLNKIRNVLLEVRIGAGSEEDKFNFVQDLCMVLSNLYTLKMEKKSAETILNKGTPYLSIYKAHYFFLLEDLRCVLTVLRQDYLDIDITDFPRYNQLNPVWNEIKEFEPCKWKTSLPAAKPKDITVYRNPIGMIGMTGKFPLPNILPVRNSEEKEMVSLCNSPATSS